MDLRAAVRVLRQAAQDAAGLTYQLRKQAGSGTWQLFVNDPNGAKVELDFDPKETAQ